MWALLKRMPLRQPSIFSSSTGVAQGDCSKTVRVGPRPVRICLPGPKGQGGRAAAGPVLGEQPMVGAVVGALAGAAATFFLQRHQDVRTAKRQDERESRAK